jgi:hypothetical protein
MVAANFAFSPSHFPYQHHKATLLPLPAMVIAAMAASWRAFLYPHRLLQLLHTRLRRLFATPVASFGPAAATASEGALHGGVGMLRERGLVEATTSDTLASTRAGEHKVYYGFDPTAESLHLGNLLGLVALSWFCRCGHTTVALVDRIKQPGLQKDGGGGCGGAGGGGADRGRPTRRRPWRRSPSRGEEEVWPCAADRGSGRGRTQNLQQPSELRSTGQIQNVHCIVTI